MAGAVLKSNAMDHDPLFKQLLQRFFSEFLEMFLPDVAAAIEPGTIEFVDKETVTDVVARERHEVDVLVRCQFRGKAAFFLIHVETQASAKTNFAQRMFRFLPA